MNVYVKGLLLFLFIPFVLYMFLRYPLGIPLSFGIALPVMFLHRFAARPFMMKHKNRRCIWCGRTADDETFSIGDTLFTACSVKHKTLTARFAGFADRFRIPIAAGIFIPLAVYIILTLLRPFGADLLPPEWSRFIFRSGIAVTVVSVSLFYRTAKIPDETPSFPFPIHNLFLLGIRETLWIFRIVGVWWIAASVLFLFRNSL